MAFYFVITKLTLNQSAIIHTSFKAHAASSLHTNGKHMVLRVDLFNGARYFETVFGVS